MNSSDDQRGSPQSRKRSILKKSDPPAHAQDPEMQQLLDEPSGATRPRITSTMPPTTTDSAVPTPVSSALNSSDEVLEMRADVATKEIQTARSAAAGAKTKFERGRDPHLKKPVDKSFVSNHQTIRDDSGIGFETQPPFRCSNSKCHHNSSEKTLFCICNDELGPADDLITLHQAETQFLFADFTPSSEETKLLQDIKNVTSQ